MFHPLSAVATLEHGGRAARLHQRILLLLGSAFPRVANRTTIAMISKTTTAITILTGVNKLGAGVGVGVGVGCGAFAAASMPRAYCKRCGVSMSFGFSFNACS